MELVVMKWFKHSTTASLELPVRDILERYGYHGVGVFWCLMERVCLSDGQFSVGELQRMFSSRKFGNDAVKSLILDYGCFVIDAHSRVSVSSAMPTVKEGKCEKTAPDSVPDTVPDTSSNTRTYNREDKIRIEKEATAKKAAAASSPSTVMMEDPDMDGVKKYAKVLQGEKKLSEWFDSFVDAAQKYPQWHEMVLMRSGYPIMLRDYWDMAMDMFKSFRICRGEWDNYVTETQAKKYIYNFLVEWPETKQDVISELGERKRKDAHINTDFMSTYSGPPLPDDAPPRPSHTAFYNFADDVWEEPREVTGVKGSKI